MTVLVPSAGAEELDVAAPAAVEVTGSGTTVSVPGDTPVDTGVAVLVSLKVNERAADEDAAAVLDNATPAAVEVPTA
jgi:hypothetical protein